jgi:hypothetical protein
MVWYSYDTMNILLTQVLTHYNCALAIWGQGSELQQRNTVQYLIIPGSATDYEIK